MHVSTYFCKNITSCRCIPGVVQVLVRAIQWKKRLAEDPATRYIALDGRARPDVAADGRDVLRAEDLEAFQEAPVLLHRPAASRV